MVIHVRVAPAAGRYRCRHNGLPCRCRCNELSTCSLASYRSRVQEAQNPSEAASGQLILAGCTKLSLIIGRGTFLISLNQVAWYTLVGPVRKPACSSLRQPLINSTHIVLGNQLYAHSHYQQIMCTTNYCTWCWEPFKPYSQLLLHSFCLTTFFSVMLSPLCLMLRTSRQSRGRRNAAKT